MSEQEFGYSPEKGINFSAINTNEVNFSKEFTNFIDKVSDFNPGDDVSKFLSDGLKKIDDYIEVLTENEQGLNKEEAETLEKKIPELNQEVLEQLGVLKFDGELNYGLTQDFRKEGHIKAGDQFCVARDSDGLDWLLKSVNHPYDKNDSGPWYTNNRLFQWERLRRNQSQVFASRVGQEVGYPIAASKLVQFNGRIWVAFVRLEGVVEITEAPARNRDLANEQDFKSRPLFNALINALGDSSFQGLIDSENKYYAHDTGVVFPKYVMDMSPAELKKYLVNNLLATEEKDRDVEDGNQDAYGFLRLDLKDETVRKSCEQFISKLCILQKNVADRIFCDMIGPEPKKRQYADHLLLRARLITEIYEELIA